MEFTNEVLIQIEEVVNNELKLKQFTSVPYFTDRNVNSLPAPLITSNSMFFDGNFEKADKFNF